MEIMAFAPMYGRCAACDAPLPEVIRQQGGGRQRLYCSDACRQRAYRIYRKFRQERAEGALDRP